MLKFAVPTMFFPSRIATFAAINHAALSAVIGPATNDSSAAAAGANLTASGTSRHVGWVSSDGRRSTWYIILSCLTIFFISSWKCTHLNIPTAEESTAGWHKCGLLPYFPTSPLRRKWRRKLVSMVWGGGAPGGGGAGARE